MHNIKPEDILAATQAGKKANELYRIISIAVFAVAIVLLFIAMQYENDDEIDFRFWIYAGLSFAVLIFGCVIEAITQKNGNNASTLLYFWIYDKIVENENLFTNSGSNLNIYISDKNGLYNIYVKEANTSIAIDAKFLYEEMQNAKKDTKNKFKLEQYMNAMYMEEIIVGKISEKMSAGKFYNNVTIYVDMFGDMPSDFDNSEWVEMGDEFIVQNMPSKVFKHTVKSYNQNMKKEKLIKK